MSWIKKEQLTSFEKTEFPIHGLLFLDGDQIARTYRASATEGYKYPMIAFPSGEEFPLWDVGSSEQGIVHLFGEMDLPLRSTRQEAYLHAQDIAKMIGYAVRMRGETQLDVWSAETDERYTLTFDDNVPIIVDVRRLEEAVEPPVHQAHILMNDEIRAQLPPLYSNEHLGLDAVASVKYFTPDANWTWYATEFDGSDVFFGLVAGYELELGLFTLSELQSLRGGLSLPIERDLHYQPKTLRELKAMHRRE